MRGPSIILEFARQRRAVALIEFALVLPLLLALLLGFAEYNRYQRYVEQLQAQAYLIANDIAGFDTATPNFSEIANVHDTALFNLPDIQADAAKSGTTYWYWQILGEQVTSVVMTPTVPGCTSNCTYNANIAFIYGTRTINNTLGSMERSCGQLTPGGPEPTATTLPPSLFQPGSLILVDLVYNFTPLFGGNFFPAITITVHAAATPNHVASYISGDHIGAFTDVCPGY